MGGSVDLNADVGEGCDDGAVLPYVTSVNVACGGHAGDDASMAATVAAAATRGIAIGAHPSYPDREHFGRRELALAPQAIEACVREQLRALLAITRQTALLEKNPDLAATIRSRLPYIDPLNHLQIELIGRRRRGDADEAVLEGVHLTINGIAAGLRNTG